jgi:hypothetical protein
MSKLVKYLSVPSVVAGVLALNNPPAFACGGISDVGCNLTHGGLSPSNIVKQGEEAPQDIGHPAEKAGRAPADAPRPRPTPAVKDR